MPKGTLVWFDDQTGEGLIRRDGREYPVRSSDIETSAVSPMLRCISTSCVMRG
jgi:cold shock CspA family protein